MARETPQQQTATFIATQLTELANTARLAGFDALVYLIDMAKLEAEQRQRDGSNVVGVLDHLRR